MTKINSNGCDFLPLKSNFSFAEMDSSPKWRTFTLTHVDYPDGDPTAKILAVISLLPLVIVIVHITVFACKRDLHTLFYGLGTILNGVLNYVLKHTIKEARPHSTVSIRDSTKLFEEYGMPSSHSQFMWFVSTYMALFVYVRLRHQESKLLKLLWVAFCFVLSVLVTYGRIYLHYHTWAQVGWGMGIGASMALVWFALVHLVLTPFFPWIVTFRVCEYLMIRDYTSIPNVMWFDYTNARSEAKNRIRKMSMKNKQS